MQVQGYMMMIMKLYRGGVHEKELKKLDDEEFQGFLTL